jgi:hypothetical protein
MALRGDLLVIRASDEGSGSVPKLIAETTSVNIDFSADALETTSQTDALNATFIAGKVTCTLSGDYLLASAGTQFSTLFGYMNAGTLIECDVLRNGAKFLDGNGVITSLSLSGGNSDTLTTGSYSIQCSGNMAL